MAFNRDGWNPIGGQSKKGTAPQMFAYTSADAIADVNTEGYFNSVSQDVAVGDIIFVHDSATPTMSIAVVLSNAAGIVDISDGTTVAVTDAD
jgi:hypothetical protein